MPVEEVRERLDVDGDNVSVVGFVVGGVESDADLLIEDTFMA